MAFSKIDLRNFRCFDSLSIDISSNSNLFYGKNGSGKTSILESIFVASSGRSFRTSNLESLIKKDAEAFNIKAYDDKTGSILEVKKARNKPINIKTPPMVGVPIFFIICSVGPSSLIGSRICLAEKNLINGVPINKTTIIEVNIASPVLTVRYLKTFRKLYWSTN